MSTDEANGSNRDPGLSAHPDGMKASMTFFCPQCWKQIPPASETCPHCGAQLAAEDAKPFVEKLRSALRHPEPETAIRAAWILGERQEASAVRELIYVLETSQDGFLAEAAAEALGKIGDPAALSALQHASVAGTARLRRTSRSAIERIRRPLRADPIFPKGPISRPPAKTNT